MTELVPAIYVVAGGFEDGSARRIDLYIGFDIGCILKPVEFAGDSLARLRDFPANARRAAGYQFDRVQRGLEPDNWKPMKTIGAGVCELRIRDRSGAFRVIYLATLPDRVVVLHAFQKKTQRTAKQDVDLAAKRLRELRRD